MKVLRINIQCVKIYGEVNKVVNISIHLTFTLQITLKLVFHIKTKVFSKTATVIRAV